MLFRAQSAIWVKYRGRKKIGLIIKDLLQKKAPFWPASIVERDNQARIKYYNLIDLKNI